VEYIVGESDSEGGAGANFLVDCTMKKDTKLPVIQGIMIGTYAQQGISFVTDGIKLSDSNSF
jgi:hypothetical protein